MGDAVYRVSKTERHEFRLNNPTPWVEVQKALRWAQQEFNKHRGRQVGFDDDILVEGDEEGVTVYFLVTPRAG